MLSHLKKTFLFLTAIFIVLLIYYHFSGQGIKVARADNVISCSLAPYLNDPGDNITISAEINFTAADVWAVIENEGGILESHYSLMADDATHYSRTYTTSALANGRYNIRVVGEVTGTGEEIICNPSSGAEWIKKSLNEISWSRRSGHSMLAFNGRLWLIGGTTQNPNSDVWKSLDGLNWQKATSSASWGVNRAEFKTIVFNNKIWLMGGYKLNSSMTTLTLQRDVWNTSDGYNWNLVTASAAWSARSMFGLAAYNNKLWVSGGCVHVNASLSCDGVDDDVWYSTDGASWTEATAAAAWPDRTAHKMINFNDGESEKLYLIGGVSLGPTTSLDDVWSSTNGSGWTLVTDAPGWEPRYFFDLENYNGKLWLLGGYESSIGLSHNDIWTTTNGSAWTEAKSDVTLGGVGYQPSTWTHWAPRRSFDATLFDDGTGMKFWLSGGSKGADMLDDVWKSGNGTDWTMVNTHFNAPFGMRFQPAMVTYNNRLWLMGGWSKSLGTQKINTNDVWSTGDGITWRCDFGSYDTAPEGLPEGECRYAAPGWVGRWDHKLVAFDEPGDAPDKGEQIFLIGGCTSTSGFTNCPTANQLRDVWSYDSDTDAWTQETAAASWNGRYGPTATVYNDKLFMMGGYRYNAVPAEDTTKQVWYSSDGAAWTQATDAVWDGRMMHQSLVYDNKLWVMGGWGTARLNDVWYSTDPINSGWTQATAGASWPGRYTFLALNYNNRMWVISGNVVGGPLITDDVWYSVDGVSWNMATNDGGFIARDFYSGAVFQDRLWLAGGDSASGGLNDVWASRFGDMTYYVVQPEEGQIMVTATVEPELSLILSADVCSFGTFNSSVISTCDYTSNISTNGTSGYTAYVRSDNDFSSGSNNFTQVSGGFINAGSEEYGIATSDGDYASMQINKQITNCEALNNTADPINAAILTNNDQSYSYNSGPVADDAVTLCHLASISNLTKAGNYSHVVIITAIGNF